jgi:DNA polymerase III subunit alpha
MTTTMYVQTDTTGAFLFRETVTHVDQPHLVRLAWVIADDAEITSAWCRLVKPRNDWTYEDDAVVANGITPEHALAHGMPLEYVMARFVGVLDGVERIVAFNADFHTKVLQRSVFECGLHWRPLFQNKTVACAMRRATDIVKKPRMAPGGGYSWPKLWEAYEYFTGEELPPLDLDPVERGLTLARCIYAIDRGIIDYNAGVSHE